MGSKEADDSHGEGSQGPGDALEELRALESDAAARDSADSGAVLSELKSAMRARDASPRDRLQRLSMARRLALSLGVGLVALLAIALGRPRPDLAGYPTLRMVAVLALLGALCVPVGRLALRPWYRRSLSTRAATTWVGVALAAALAFAALPVAHTWLPHTAPPIGQALWQHAAGCLAFGTAVGAPVFLVTWLTSRDTPHAGLMATALAGLVGNLALQLHCPITEHAHLLAGHATVGVASLLLLAIPAVARR